MDAEEADASAWGGTGWFIGLFMADMQSPGVAGWVVVSGKLSGTGRRGNGNSTAEGWEGWLALSSQWVAIRTARGVAGKKLYGHKPPPQGCPGDLRTTQSVKLLPTHRFDVA